MKPIKAVYHPEKSPLLKNVNTKHVVIIEIVSSDRYPHPLLAIFIDDGLLRSAPISQFTECSFSFMVDDDQ